jgi:hypothetical protein
MSNEEKLSVLSLMGSDTYVIRKSKTSRFFITTPDTIIIGKDGLVFLMNFLVKNGFIHYKVLEGILEEVHTE